MLSSSSSSSSSTSKHFVFSKTPQDVFSVTRFLLPRRLQDVFAIRLPKTSSRRLPSCFQDVFEDVWKTCLQDVLQLYLDIFKTKKSVTLKTSSVRLHQDKCLLGMFYPTLIVDHKLSSENEHTFPMNSFVPGDVTYADVVKSVKRFLIGHRQNGIVILADSITRSKRVRDFN